MNKKSRSDFEPEIIKAIHEDQFEGFLKSLGVLNVVKEGMCKCKFCGDVVSLNNIYTVFPESGQIKFSCDKIRCMVQLSKYLSEK